MSTFTLGEGLPDRCNSASQTQLLARALRWICNERGQTIEKKPSDKTGFKCNHYPAEYLEPIVVLLYYMKRFSKANDRNWYSMPEQISLVNEHFLNNLGYHADWLE